MTARSLPVLAALVGWALLFGLALAVFAGCADPGTAGVLAPLPTLTPVIANCVGTNTGSAFIDQAGTCVFVLAPTLTPTPIAVMRCVFGTPGAAAAADAPPPAPRMVFVEPVAPGVATGTREDRPVDVF